MFPEVEAPDGTLADVLLDGLDFACDHIIELDQLHPAADGVGRDDQSPDRIEHPRGDRGMLRPHTRQATVAQDAPYPLLLED